MKSNDLISRKYVIKELLKEREHYPPMVAERYSFGVKMPHSFNQAMRGGIRKALRIAETAPAVDAVSLGVYEQVKLERDALQVEIDVLNEEYYAGIHTIRPAVDAEPVRHDGCALCHIKETGHGVIAFYGIGWQVCINKRGKNYYLVMGHEGSQTEMLIGYCPACGAKKDGDKDAVD